MKTSYKTLINLTLSALFCVLSASTVSAQRGSTGGGGGGGGSRSSGGGGGGGAAVSAPRSSGGGSGSVSAPRSSGGGNAGYSRPSGSGIAPQRPSGVNPGYNRGVAPARGNYGYAPRGNYGYAPRTGYSTARGNYDYAPRVGVSPRAATVGGSSYRVSPRVGYGGGYGSGYWGNHGYYYYNQGYYNSYYLPRLGFSCGYLPYGYYPFFYGDNQYYYSDGLFYQYDNSQYTVVEPPVGAEVTTLPDKAQSIVINGQQYYELNGVYYQPYTKDDGTVVYEVAGKDGELNTTATQGDQQPQGPQMGDVVNQLPNDCRKLKVNGQKLYVSPDGVYYQEMVDTNKNKVYKVVGLPSDEPDQN